MLYCTICNNPIEPHERIKHAKDVHGIKLSEVIQYSVFGEKDDNCMIPETFAGLCGECDTYLSSFEILSRYEDEEGIIYVLRCGECNGLLITDTIADLKVPLIGTDEEEEDDDELNEAEKEVILHKGATCNNCKNCEEDKKFDFYMCSAFDSEVIIDRRALNIAESCNEYEPDKQKIKENKKKK